MQPIYKEERERLAYDYSKIIESVNKTQEFGELDEEWLQIKPILGYLVERQDVIGKFLFLSLIMVLDEYLRIRGDFENHTNWYQHAIRVSSVFDSANDRDFDIPEYIATDLDGTTEIRHWYKEDFEAALNGNAGLSYLLQGQFDKADTAFKQSLRLARKTGNKTIEANALNNIGLICKHRGQYNKAITYEKQALDIARELGHESKEGAYLGNIGEAYRYLKQFKQAIAYQEEALAIARKIGDKKGEGSRLGNLGTNYAQTGQLERAIVCYEQGLKIAEEIGDKLGKSNRLANMGRCYFELGQTDLGIEYVTQGLEIKRNIGNKRGEAEDLSWLGLAYIELGQSANALDYLERSRDIYASLNLQHEVKHMDQSISLCKQYIEKIDTEVDAIPSETEVNIKETPLFESVLEAAKTQPDLVKKLQRIVRFELMMAKSPFDIQIQKEYVTVAMEIASSIQLEIDSQEGLNEYLSWLSQNGENLLQRTKNKPRNVDRRLWFQWIIACTIGLGIGTASFDLIGFWGIAAFGASIGVTQWLVLRQYVPRVSSWVWWTTIGSVIGFMIVPGRIGALSVGAMVGAALGLAQWNVMQWRGVVALTWILTSAVGFALGFAVANPVGLSISSYMGSILSGAIGGAVSGILVGVITGAGLIWSLKRSTIEQAA